MDYTLRELECFTAVAEELSFTRAARRLHLAQPPLSRHIRVLEEKIGARLFERHPRSVALTPAGRLFHEETRGLLPQLVRAGDAARRSANGESTRMRLGFVSAVLSDKLVDVLREFREAHPSVQIMLHDLPPAEQLQLIEQGKLDAGFIGLMPAERPASVRFVRWSEERLLAFLPSGHALAGKQRLHLSDLKDERFVAVSSEAAPAFASLLRDLCRQSGFRPRIVLESARAQAVAVMVAAGSGVAILPESLSNIARSSAVGIPLKGSPKVTHFFALSEGPATGAMKNFIALLSRSPR